jgi:ubiquinone/menaquinone biosynthesis C-methylase UbiE
MPPATPSCPDHHEQVKHAARSHFDRWADSYDRSRLSELVFFPSIRACWEELTHWQVRRGGGPYQLVDVGCGTGNLLISLLDDPHAERLIGLDYSEEMVSRLQSKIAAGGRPDRLQVLHGDAEHLPFDDASLEVVTCCNSFHHYPHQAAVVREFRRVLRPGGMLILIDGFRDNVIGWVIFDVAVALVERMVHHASWSEVRVMLEQAGFNGIQQRKVNVLAPLLVSVATC